MMSRSALLGGVAVFMLVVAPAGANGPSGSTEQDADGNYTNQTQCDAGTATPAGGVVYVGENGAEVCNDGDTIPVQGRVIVTTDDGGYAAIDGDADNEGTATQLGGWARVDGSGVRCGDDAGRRDSTAPTSEDTMEDCG